MSLPTATVVLDSISPEGIRLPTLHLRYWRAIHAELMTHRVFSRNARSSRAVPISKMIEEVRNDPFIPQHWGRNQRGMQATEECNEPVSIWSLTGEGYVQRDRETAWLMARDLAVDSAQAFAIAGYHKQLVNRLLEPFMWIDTLLSSTDWANFFHLRLHSDAEPHFVDLARAVRVALNGSTPTLLQPNKWHLPYINNGWKLKSTQIETARKVSAARCARISYAPFDGNSSIEAEIERHDKLIGNECVHASPLEHQATPDSTHLLGSEPTFDNPEEHGNLRGWRQYRKMIKGEAISD